MNTKKRIFDHPIIFTGLVILGILLLPVPFAILPAMFPGAFSTMIATLIPAVMIAIAVKCLIGKDFLIGITDQKLMNCFKLCIPLVIIGLIGTGVALSAGGQLVSTIPMILTVLFTSITAGVFEELIFRGIICNNMMRCLKDKKAGIYLAVFGSAISFSLIHLINVRVTGFSIGLLAQLILSGLLGVFFGAVYVRTRNIIGLMAAHFLWDAFALAASGGTIAGNLGSVDMIGLLMNIGTSIIIGAIGLYMIRQEKHAEIIANWSN